MKTFKTINPYNLQEIGTYEAFSSEELRRKLENSEEAFKKWKETPFQYRAGLLAKVSGELRSGIDKYAATITEEMGKPILQSKAELEKCAWVCEFYAENAEQFLRDEIIESPASKSYVSYEPLGVILAIMPWNFPWWQVLRFLAPALMAGNVALLKHAPNVFGTSLMIEEIFRKVGYPDGVFQNLIVDIDKVPEIIQDPRVKAVTLTGSDTAGAQVASQAGSAIKKAVLELGGSNAFIVLEDANLEKAVQEGITGRMQNNGQSCIAAKRFMLQKGIASAYLEKFKEKLINFQPGDPLDELTTIGPLARVDLAEKLEDQVRESIGMGAKLLLGGNRQGAYFEPTMLTEVKPGMPAFDEELFGPVAAFIEVDNLEEAITLSNLSAFGLGVTIFTENVEEASRSVKDFDDGAVFINSMVKSDPRLPFGGTKRSGYGRELSWHGIREFVNAKTVFIS